MISFWLLSIFYDKGLKLTHISAIETRSRNQTAMDHVVSPSLIACLFCLHELTTINIYKVIYYKSRVVFLAVPFLLTMTF